MTQDDIILYGSIKTIDGFQMVDGTDVPVQVSFNVTDVQEGESGSIAVEEEWKTSSRKEKVVLILLWSAVPQR